MSRGAGLLCAFLVVVAGCGSASSTSVVSGTEGAGTRSPTAATPLISPAPSAIPNTWRSEGSLAVQAARITADRSALVVSFIGGQTGLVESDGCWEGYGGTAAVVNGVVTIDVTRYTSTKSPGSACSAVGFGRLMTIPLPHPLAKGEQVADQASGQPVSVIDVEMPTPTWLPDGWVELSERGFSGWSVTYGLPDPTGGNAGPSMTISVEPIAAIDNWRGASTVKTVSVQGRTALFILQPGSPAGYPPALLMQDSSWILTLDRDASPGVDEATVLRFAEGLHPLPFTGTVTANTVPGRLTGGVADLLGKEGPATVTGWLVVTADGQGQLCDMLASRTPPSCTSPIMTVDWSPVNGTPPGDLTLVGDRKVSNTPVTIAGSLKGDFLYPGVL